MATLDVLQPLALRGRRRRPCEPSVRGLQGGAPPTPLARGFGAPPTPLARGFGAPPTPLARGFGAPPTPLARGLREGNVESPRCLPGTATFDTLRVRVSARLGPTLSVRKGRT